MGAPPWGGGTRLCGLRPPRRLGGAALAAAVGLLASCRAVAAEICVPELVAVGAPFGGACPTPIELAADCSTAAAYLEEVPDDDAPALEQAEEDRPFGCWWQAGNAADEIASLLFFNTQPVGAPPAACSAARRCVCCKPLGSPAASTTTTTTTPSPECLAGYKEYGDAGGAPCLRAVQSREECTLVGSAVASSLGWGPAAAPAAAQSEDDRPEGCWMQPGKPELSEFHSLYFNEPPSGGSGVACSGAMKCLCCIPSTTTTTSTRTSTSTSTRTFTSTTPTSTTTWTTSSTTRTSTTTSSATTTTSSTSSSSETSTRTSTTPSTTATSTTMTATTTTSTAAATTTATSDATVATPLPAVGEVSQATTTTSTATTTPTTTTSTSNATLVALLAPALVETSQASAVVIIVVGALALAVLLCVLCAANFYSRRAARAGANHEVYPRPELSPPVGKEMHPVTAPLPMSAVVPLPSLASPSRLDVYSAAPWEEDTTGELQERELLPERMLPDDVLLTTSSVEGMERNSLIHGVFGILDTAGRGLLQSPDIQIFAEFVGFKGSDEQWRAEFAEMCSYLGCDPVLGIDMFSFTVLLNDSSAQGCFVSNAELRVFREESISGCTAGCSPICGSSFGCSGQALSL
mmetsp:Transcript_28818/g.92622  ORF Transcript_28818/g.92622 Transcript_28818/m.92622 type:complete len:635 (+) Transcript_28818:3-1907(+)